MKMKEMSRLPRPMVDSEWRVQVGTSKEDDIESTGYVELQSVRAISEIVGHGVLAAAAFVRSVIVMVVGGTLEDYTVGRITVSKIGYGQLRVRWSIEEVSGIGLVQHGKSLIGSGTAFELHRGINRLSNVGVGHVMVKGLMHFWALDPNGRERCNDFRAQRQCHCERGCGRWD